VNILGIKVLIPRFQKERVLKECVHLGEFISYFVGLVLRAIDVDGEREYTFGTPPYRRLHQS
jgi:hypothetical protein